MSSQGIFVAAGTGQELFVLGDFVTIKIHGRDTGGTLSQITTTCGPKIGPPLHVHHREDETFYVIAGEFEFICGGERTTGGPGTVARLPRGVPHRFANIGTSPGHLLVTMTPSGFEGFFEEIGALTREEQADMPQVVALAARYGLEFVADSSITPSHTL